MELDNLTNAFESWGIDSFDRVYTGLPKRIFNLLRTCNEETTLSALGHYLKTGLDRDERVTLVCFDHPAYLLAGFKEHGFSFDDALQSEQFIYLYYKPWLSHSLNFSTNYQPLIDEAKYLSKGNSGRIAFRNADVLFNLETHLLAESSAEKIMSSLNSGDCLVLGCYQGTESPTHQLLDDISKTCLRSYMEIRSGVENSTTNYELVLHKFPLFHAKQNIHLHLTRGLGFNSPALEFLKHG